MSISVRPLKLSDVAAVSHLISDSFSVELRPFMAYTQHGVGAFLSVPLEYPGSDPDRHLLVALDSARPEEIAGFAEFRTAAGGVGFLSYICVAKSVQGRGVARALFRAFQNENPGLQELQLDVFRDNVRAVSLYRKLGFDTQSSVAWVTRSMPPGTGTAKIRALALAIANHSVYGFCELAVVSEAMETKIGLIGERVLRCFSAESFDDDVLLSGLKIHFPRVDTALAILSTDTLPVISKNHKVINYSDRMTLSLPGYSAL